MNESNDTHETTRQSRERVEISNKTERHIWHKVAFKVSPGLSDILIRLIDVVQVGGNPRVQLSRLPLICHC